MRLHSQHHANKAACKENNSNAFETDFHKERAHGGPSKSMPDRKHHLGHKHGEASGRFDGAQHDKLTP
jgi:hypothetical protein